MPSALKCEDEKSINHFELFIPIKSDVNILPDAFKGAIYLTDSFDNASLNIIDKDAKFIKMTPFGLLYLRSIK